MSDWSAFEAEVRSNTLPRGPRCGVAVMLHGLGDHERRAVEPILTDRRFQVPAILKALVRYGIEPPSSWSLSNHRRGKCACQR